MHEARGVCFGQRFAHLLEEIQHALIDLANSSSTTMRSMTNRKNGALGYAT